MENIKSNEEQQNNRGMYLLIKNSFRSLPKIGEDMYVDYEKKLVFYDEPYESVSITTYNGDEPKELTEEMAYCKIAADDSIYINANSGNLDSVEGDIGVGSIEGLFTAVCQYMKEEKEIEENIINRYDGYYLNLANMLKDYTGAEPKYGYTRYEFPDSNLIVYINPDYIYIQRPPQDNEYLAFNDTETYLEIKSEGGIAAVVYDKINDRHSDYLGSIIIPNKMNWENNEDDMGMPWVSIQDFEGRRITVSKGENSKDPMRDWLEDASSETGNKANEDAVKLWDDFSKLMIQLKTKHEQEEARENLKERGNNIEALKAKKK